MSDTTPRDSYDWYREQIAAHERRRRRNVGLKLLVYGLTFVALNLFLMQITTPRSSIPWQAIAAGVGLIAAVIGLLKALRNWGSVHA